MGGLVPKEKELLAWCKTPQCSRERGERWALPWLRGTGMA